MQTCQIVALPCPLLMRITVESTGKISLGTGSQIRTTPRASRECIVIDATPSPEASAI